MILKLESYDSIIENLINKKINVNDLIDILNKNRFEVNFNADEIVNNVSDNSKHDLIQVWQLFKIKIMNFNKNVFLNFRIRYWMKKL